MKRLVLVLAAAAGCLVLGLLLVPVTAENPIDLSKQSCGMPIAPKDYPLSNLGADAGDREIQERFFQLTRKDTCSEEIDLRRNNALAAGVLGTLTGVIYLAARAWNGRTGPPPTHA